MAKSKVGKKLPMPGLAVPECPVCMDNMTSPIFQCQSGHSLCHVCTQKLVPSICPLCSQVMTQMRNWQLEELVDKAKKPCPNKTLGCYYIMKSAEVEDHLKECIFRDVNCPHGETFGACSWSGKIKDLLEHFKMNHAENCRILLDQEADVAVNSAVDNRLMFLLSQGKFLFLLTIKIDTYQQMVYYVIQHIGTNKFAQNYIYEINIVSKRDSRRKAIFTDHCYGDSYDIKEIFSNGKCGIMPLKMLSHFVQNNTIVMKISISRNETFVKNPKDSMKKEPFKQREEQNSRAKSPGPHIHPKGPKAPGKQKAFQKK